MCTFFAPCCLQTHVVGSIISDHSCLQNEREEKASETNLLLAAVLTVSSSRPLETVRLLFGFAKHKKINLIVSLSGRTQFPWWCKGTQVMREVYCYFSNSFLFILCCRWVKPSESPAITYAWKALKFKEQYLSKQRWSSYKSGHYL